MTRERWSTLVRWAGMMAAGGLLVVALSARGPGEQPPAGGSGPLAPGAGGQTPLVSGIVSDLAAAGITGPYTSVIPAKEFTGDLSQIPYRRPAVQPALAGEAETENEAPTPAGLSDPVVQSSRSSLPNSPSMPGPLKSFAGLDFTTWGTGWPPDPNGDVGPTYYVQTVNTSVGIFNKSTGQPAARFFYADLWAGAGTGTACDSDNRGDPVALYDAAADRYIVSDFAFTPTAYTTNGPYFECVAASITNDPVAGGWHLYALRTDDDAARYFADYPKLGVWPDGIYMSANRYDCQGSAGCSAFTNQGVRVWALNKDDLYHGQPLRVQHFDVSNSYFGLLPSNLKGTAPPAGTPNYFVSNDLGSFALDVFKFHVDWNTESNSSFTGPTAVTIAAFNSPPPQIPEQTGAPLDSLGSRLMMQNQYRNLGGNESLWVTHTADNAPSGVRWYQLNVSGGKIAPMPVQQSTYKPDSNYRWMPSLAVDKYGNMAIGYSVSSSGIHPAIRYAGRLSGDPANTLGQGETTLIAGNGGQTNCGGVTCSRWGDYSSMTVDPTDDCTFWYTNEYYAVDGDDWQTQIGSFRFPGCGVVYSNFTYLPLVANDNWVTVFQEGFEGAWPSTGWTLEDNTSGAYKWGKSACQAHSGGFAGWAIGGGSMGAGLGCGANYPDGAQIWMIHDPVSLAGATAAEFDLQVMAKVASAGDYVAWLASVDGNKFYGYETSANSAGFVAQSLDLSSVPVPVGMSGNFLGQPNVWAAVLFFSDGSGNLPNGAFVDDLLLRKCVAAACGGPARPSAAGGNPHAIAVTLKQPPG